jgi:hypothetical protein
MKTAPQHYELILKAAEKLGCAIQAASPGWTGCAFNAELLGSTASRRSIQRDERDLPDLVAASRIDETPVLVGELKGPPDRAVIEEQMRRYRNQAMIARSWLGEEGPNLQLFLISPAGGRGSQDWRQRAAQIEADDRICRKLVWMMESTATLEGAVEFMGRTFAARPWTQGEGMPKALDELEIGLPAGWEAAVDNDGLDAEGVVLEIVRMEGEAK